MVSIFQGEHKYYFFFSSEYHSTQNHDWGGTIDGTHVTARVLKAQSSTYRERKHYTSQNVLATVDFDMRFTYVLDGWEGSARSHDELLVYFIPCRCVWWWCTMLRSPLK